ncbi:hypothetical protein [Streptomyces sp. NPDC021212]|uniref:hypothetical protein n=1 Tax=Streptomyces sp. NPDC021212 TaxID=3365118 RepID=UPI0037904AEB
MGPTKRHGGYRHPEWRWSLCKMAEATEGEQRAESVMWWRTKDSDYSRVAPEKPRSIRRESERELARRIRRMLRELEVEPPLSVHQLCKALSVHRGRHIELRPYPLPTSGPIGLWLDTPHADLIIFQDRTTPRHQDHIILHEVGHILADHPGTSADLQWETLLPGLKPGAIRRALQRCSYGTEQEREAELVATIILSWASVLDHVTDPPSPDPAVRRIHSALGDRMGWL